MSGGGFLAMLFHAGALWRLNEFGLLKGLARISSVSGGSITAGLLGLKWSQLAFGNSDSLRRHVVDPLRDLAARTIDIKAVATGALLPGTIGDRIIAAYKKFLYGEATLQHPVWRAMAILSSVYGRLQSRNDQGPHAAARSRRRRIIRVSAVSFACNSRAQLGDVCAGSGTDLQYEPFTTEVVLTDGGVYDNLGLETAWKRYDSILVSDAGGKLQAPTKANVRSSPRDAG
jgi:NTE family protein